MGLRKSEDHHREIDKLRGEIQSLERQMRDLDETRVQLQQSQERNERLTASLREAKSHVERLRNEIAELTAPPSSYAVFCSLNDDRTANVYVSGRKMRVRVHDSVDGRSLRKGQEVVVNEALNVIESRGFDPQGQVVTLQDRLEGTRALIRLHHDEERVVELGEPLLRERLNVGDHLLYDGRSGYVIEKLPKAEVEELVMEEVPDVRYVTSVGWKKKSNR